MYTWTSILIQLSVATQQKKNTKDEKLKNSLEIYAWLFIFCSPNERKKKANENLTVCTSLEKSWIARRWCAYGSTLHVRRCVQRHTNCGLLIESNGSIHTYTLHRHVNVFAYLATLSASWFHLNWVDVHWRMRLCVYF